MAGEILAVDKLQRLNLTGSLFREVFTGCGRSASAWSAVYRKATAGVSCRFPLAGRKPFHSPVMCQRLVYELSALRRRVCGPAKYKGRPSNGCSLTATNGSARRQMREAGTEGVIVIRKLVAAMRESAFPGCESGHYGAPSLAESRDNSGSKEFGQAGTLAGVVKAQGARAAVSGGTSRSTPETKTRRRGAAVLIYIARSQAVTEKKAAMLKFQHLQRLTKLSWQGSALQVAPSNN